jgi:hypothetical protein
MGKQVTILTGFRSIKLPGTITAIASAADQLVASVGQRSYTSGDVVTLTDAEYAALDTATLRALSAPTTVAQPARPAVRTAIAGSPGSFSSGQVVPATFSDLVPWRLDTSGNRVALTSPVTASPATAWTAGQYVLLADGSAATWNGTAWIVQVNATAGIPGGFSTGLLGGSAAPVPANLAALTANMVTAVPATAWTTGQYVSLKDGSKASWVGATPAWVAGAAP